MVMYSGLVVEHARVEALFETPSHPSTRPLLDALPMRDTSQETLRSIAGQPPLLMAPPDSCPFAPRCSHAFDRCREENPGLAKAGHPHTKALLSAVPVPDPKVEAGRRRILLKGDLPDPANPPAGCCFCARCPSAVEICFSEQPAAREIDRGQSVARHLA